MHSSEKALLASRRESNRSFLPYTIPLIKKNNYVSTMEDLRSGPGLRRHAEKTNSDVTKGDHRANLKRQKTTTKTRISNEVGK